MRTKVQLRPFIASLKRKIAMVFETDVTRNDTFKMD
jgi:hypothetical protein